MPRRDPTLDTLLDLQVFFIDEKARYWRSSRSGRVEPSAERPHGIVPAAPFDRVAFEVPLLRTAA